MNDFTKKQWFNFNFIVIKMKIDAKNFSVFFFLIFISLGSLYAQYNMPVEVIHYSSSPSQATNMVILGDGYTIEEQAKFINDAKKASSEMLNQLPWSNYKENINVFAIKVVSEVSGASLDPNNLINNYFGSSFWSYNIERLLVAWRSNKVWSVLMANTPFYDIGVIMVNDNKYGGSGGSFAVFSTNENATEIMIHELGHSFVYLADEYWAGQQYAGEKPNMTQETSPATIKWRDFLNRNGVGIYPYEESPTWQRPHQNCKMRFLGRSFCDVCSHELERKLQYLSTEPDPDIPITFFGADNLEIHVNEKINFFDFSSYSPTSWEWTFEGGMPSSSNEKNPEVSYKNEGRFSVTLKTKNDQGENILTKSGIINVLPERIDNIPPNIKFKNIEVGLDNSGKATITPADVDNGTTDDVGLEKLELSKTTFDCEDIGENIVNFKAVDKSGNEASAEVVITVVDKTKPIAKGKNIEIQLDENGNAVLRVEDVDDGSFDNCGIKELILSKSTFTCEDLGENTVNFKAIDNSGNEGEVEIIVKIVEKVNPTVKAKNIEIHLDGNGSGIVRPEDVDDGSFDNCGIKELILSKSTFHCGDLGENTVIFKAIDKSGNEASAEVVITVVDKTEPTIKAKNVEIQLDENGFATLSPEDVDDGSYDNCEISVMTLSKTEFGRGDAGENKVRFTVHDMNSNVASVEITVIVNIILSTENGEISENLKLYPNPANDIVFIEYLKFIDPQLESIEIMDINGRVLNDVRAFERNGNVIPVDVKGLKSGQYFIRLNSQKSVKILRFAIVR
jgi:PKD repeat protein